MKPLLTIVIPCYNHGAFLIEAIDSVLENDDKDICEIVVVNDGSTYEETKAILAEFKHPKVLIHNQENKGLAAARNKGISLSNCDYSLLLDSDNKITKEFLNTFLSTRDKGIEFDAIHGNSRFFGEKYDQEEFIYKSEQLNLIKISERNYIDACSIVKNETLKGLGFYDENMPSMGLEDWDLWIRMALKGKKVLYVDKTLFHYRYSSNSMIRTIGDGDALVREYLVKKHNNVMFQKDFLKQNFPIEQLEDIQSKRLVKELWRRFLHKLNIK